MAHLVLGTTAASLISEILDLAMIALVITAGIRAKRASLRPVGVGVVMGLIYAFLSGIANIVKTPSSVQLSQALHKEVPSLSPAEIHHMVAISTSLGARIAMFVVGILVGLVMGIVFSWIGSLFTRPPQDHRQVV
ncbi:MAG: hypothetical protein C7B46_01850 [Sulfobacillus benefaciens]|uniref:Uncharacterized protein n=1 Tax=Sulfobacillus benefaciens TaxID=453960 RepID=A0A2T2XL14_9FIRM|nr:MAG: hypothetical protein C7B46_01850 [Sulfobacillus benefaciens]